MKSAVGLLTFATLTLVSIEGKADLAHLKSIVNYFLYSQVIPAEYTFPTPTQ